MIFGLCAVAVRTGPEEARLPRGNLVGLEQPELMSKEYECAKAGQQLGQR